MTAVQGVIPIWTIYKTNGQLNANGYIIVEDYNTRQPTTVYATSSTADGSKVELGSKIDLNEYGQPIISQIFFDTEKTYYLRFFDSDNAEYESLAQPYAPQAGSGGSDVINNVEVENLFINGQFDFFQIQKFEPIPDGNFDIASGAWNFTKTGVNDEATLEFIKFSADEIDVDATPVHYLRYTSPINGVDETQADLNYSFINARTLSNEPITLSFSAKSFLASNFFIEILTEQFIQGGAITTSHGSVLLNQNWEQKTFSFTVPNLIGEVLRPDGGGLNIVLRYPLNTNLDIGTTNLYCKRGGASLTYAYQSYREVLAQVNALEIPRYIATSLTDDEYFANESDQSYYALQLSPRNGKLVPEWSSPVPVGGTILWMLNVPPPGGYVLCQGQNIPKNGVYHRICELFGDLWGIPEDNINFDSYPSPNIVRFRNLIEGSPPAWSAGTAPFSISEVGGQPLTTYDITCTDASTLKSGDYFIVSLVSGAQFAIYCIKDNLNLIPEGLGVQLNFFRVFTGQTATEVAQAVGACMNPLILRIPDYRGYMLRVADRSATVDPDASSRTSQFFSPYKDSPAGDNPGSVQQSAIQTHDIPYTETNYPVTQENSFKPVAVIDGDPATDNPNIQTLNKTATYNGAAETRSTNIYVNLAMKY